jgi:hypothetical protein
VCAPLNLYCLTLVTGNALCGPPFPNHTVNASMLPAKNVGLIVGLVRVARELMAR